MDEEILDSLFQFQEIEHCTTEQCIYKDGKIFPYYTVTPLKVSLACNNEEIILQQKPENNTSFSTAVYVYDFGKIFFSYKCAIH